MTKNIGDTDRIVRFLLGAVLVLVGLLVPMSSAALQAILILIGVYLIVTAAVRTCLVYKLLNFSTYR